MVPLSILTLIAAPSPAPSVLVLKSEEEPAVEGKSRVVPIYIGAVEAIALTAALEERRFARPSTHDLMLDALANLDATVDHVLINDARGDIFFARLTLSQHGRLIDIDARPSDAINLAIRQDANIFIDEQVLERTSFPYIFRQPLDEETAVEDFRDFLEHLSPADFE